MEVCDEGICLCIIPDRLWSLLGLRFFRHEKYLVVSRYNDSDYNWYDPPAQLLQFEAIGGMERGHCRRSGKLKLRLGLHQADTS